MSDSSVTRWAGVGVAFLLGVAAWFAWWRSRVEVMPAPVLASEAATTLRQESVAKPTPTEARVALQDATTTSEAASVQAKGQIVVTLRWADDDAPVVGYDVVVTDQWIEGILHRLDGASTDASGVATVSLAPGDYYVMVWNDLGRRVRVRAGERIDLTLSLPRGSALAGRVVDEHDAPVAGATVFELRGAFGGGVSPVATSGADGAFRAQLVRNGGLVFARKPGSGASGLEPVEAKGDAVARVELVLAATTTSLRGRVVDPANQPLSGARVALAAWTPPSRRGPDGASAWHEMPGLPEAHTDASGAFAFADVAVGEGVWWASAPGRRAGTGRFEARPGVIAEVSIVLAADGARLRGRVVDRDGRPAADVTVGTHRRPSFGDARTGPDGLFSFEVTPGRVEVVARSRALGAAVQTVEVANGEQREVELQLRADPVLHGRVVDERGAPLAGLWVVTSSPARTWQPFTSDATDADGGFTIVACAPNALDVKVREGQVGQGAVLAHAEGVAAGIPPLTLVVKDAARPSAFLRLRIDDPAHPTRECHVLVSNLDSGVDEGFAIAAGRTARLGPLVPGSYRLRQFHVYHPDQPILGLQLGPIVLAAHEVRDLGTHVLLPTTSLRLSLRRSDGTVPRHVPALRLVPADGSEASSASVTANGQVHPFSFRPGRYRVEVQGWVDFATASAEVELREGQTTTLAIELPALRPCAIRLRLPEGRDAPKQVAAQVRAEGGDAQRVFLWNGAGLQGLRLGEYTVTVDSEGCRGSARFTVDSLASDELRVDLPVQ